MPRQVFTDERWTKLKAIMLGFKIYDKPILRQTVEGIFIACGLVAPSETCPLRLENGMSVVKNARLLVSSWKI